MDSVQRREEIVKTLMNSSESISAGALAQMFGVTRQIVVSDVALLRANGNVIISTNKGYSMRLPEIEGYRISVVCKHNEEQTLDEFYAVVDNGGVVENVIIEHPLYGQISADLSIASRYDAEEFVEKAKAVNASQLCELTDGVHVHTIKVRDEKCGARIIDRLDKLGILIK